MSRYSWPLMLIVSLVVLGTSRIQAQEATETEPAQAEAEPAASTDAAAEQDKKPEEAKEQPAADPTGTWTWTREFNGNEIDFVLKLDWDGKELTGKYTSFGQSSDIEEAEVNDDGFSFVVEREMNGNAFDVEFEGKATEDEIRGTTSVNFGGQPRDFEWHAERSVGEDDVVGEWVLRIDTPNGVMEPSITIKKQDDALAGNYSSQFGDREAKNVKLDENQLEWEISSDDGDDFSFSVVYKGKPRGNAMAGTSTYDFDGNTGEMEFTAKRTPPKQEVEDKATDTETEANAEVATPSTDE